MGTGSCANSKSLSGYFNQGAFVVLVWGSFRVTEGLRGGNL